MLSRARIVGRSWDCFVTSDRVVQQKVRASMGMDPTQPRCGVGDLLADFRSRLRCRVLASWVDRGTAFVTSARVVQAVRASLGMDPTQPRCGLGCMLADFRSRLRCRVLAL